MARTPDVSRVCLVAAILLAASCDRPAERGGGSTRVTAAEETAVQLEAPTLDELGNASYAGIYDRPVQLADGRYEGEPFVEGGASRPSAGLAPEFRLTGDLDGDGAEEAVVLLWASSGGSGTFNYVAVAGRREDDVVNLGTAPLGDRVQVRAARVVDGTVELDVVQAGPDDAACCPSQTATRTWALGGEGDGLTEVSTAVTGDLSLATLEDVEWVLTTFDRAEPAPDEPEVTLVFSDGRIGGRSGCNRYFAGVIDGDLPGGLSVGQLGATKMACPDEVMRLEERYLRTLAGATKFGFVAGRLIVTCRVDDAIHSMTFVSREPAG
jgi:heat shock protein HslJ